MGKTKNIIQFKLTMRKTVFILLITVLFSSLYPKESNEEKVDYLTLAAMLIKDGLYDRASDTLNNYDTSQKNADLGRYYTLSGLVLLKKSLFVDAEERFLSAVKNGQTELVVWVYIAQSRYGGKNHKGTLEALKKAGDISSTMPAMISIEAECYWKTGQHEKAWSALKKGIKLHPQYSNFLRQQYFYLIELGLYKQAVEIGYLYLKKHEAVAEDYLAIGMALRQAGMYDEAIVFLEAARLKYPKDQKVLAQLGRVWMESGHILAAALLFDQASNSDPKYIADAAELYRRAKKLHRALLLNTRISDQKEKIRQKMAVWLEMEEYELVAGMTDDLQRTGLLQNDNIRYALAYSYFSIGSFQQAEKHLKKLTTPEYFSKAADLRREIERCKVEEYSCN